MLINFSLPSMAKASHQSDESLAKQAQQSPKHFGRLYERHANRIYTYCLSRTGNIEDAQDLTSEIFLAAFENLEKYNIHRSFVGWLYGIAHHKTVDHFRRHRSSISLEQYEDLPDADNNTEDFAFQEIEMKEVAYAIKMLNRDQAEALSLRIFAGLSAAEVGQIMGKSEAAVKMLVHRALRSLNKHLARDLELI